MSGMAEVLAAHQSVSYEPDYDGMGNNGIWCDMCGEGEDNPVECEDAWLAKHQAAMLTAAGFGPVKEAAAKALEDAAEHLEEDASQSSYTDVTQGQLDAAEYLRARARAATVRGES